MGDRSGIQWTDATWNPIRGCSRVSAGCMNCYAERQAIRQIQTGYAGLIKRTSHGPAWTGEVRLVPELLDQPLRWARPRRIFVNSMSDLFHERLEHHEIEKLFGVMGARPQHTFQVLTKRPQRMLDLLTDAAFCEMAWHEAEQHTHAEMQWPFPNVWLGVSIENQETADARIPLLLQTPAAVRFVSYEPALGPITFPFNAQSCWCPICKAIVRDSLDFPHERRHQVDLGAAFDPQKHCANVHDLLHWVIVGGESGPRARPCDIGWIRSAVEQCKAGSVPVFVKQVGAFVTDRNDAGFDGCDPGSWPLRPDGCDPEIEDDPFGTVE